MTIAAARFDVASLTFAVMWQNVELRIALGVMGDHVQGEARRAGRDDPAGFYFCAAEHFREGDRAGCVARNACRLTACAFEDGACS